MHLSTHTWMRPEPLEQTIKRAASLGYQSIELAGDTEKYHANEVRQLLKKYGMFCWATVTLMFAGRDLISPDPSVRASTVEYIVSVVDLAAELNAKVVTVVPSTVGKLMPGAAPEDEWRWAVDGLKQVNEVAKAKGVKLALEPLNRFETYFINRSDQALALADAVDSQNVGLCFDPFHLAIEEQNLYAALEKAGPRVLDFHLGDSNRLSAGQGSFDWARIVGILRRIGYDGGLAHEAMPAIDRTPASPYEAIGGQLETGEVDVEPGLLQFLRDHASGVLAERYYTQMCKQAADHIRPLIA